MQTSMTATCAPSSEWEVPRSSLEPGGEPAAPVCLGGESFTLESQDLEGLKKDLEHCARSLLRHHRWAEGFQQDLVDEGWISLCKSARTFEPGRASFWTYAEKGARGAMQDYLNTLLPPSSKRKAKEGKSDQEVEGAINPGGLESQQGNRLVSFDALGEAIADMWCSDAADPERSLVERERKDRVAALLNRLTEQDRCLLKKRFGIGCKEVNLSELARQEGGSLRGLGVRISRLCAELRENELASRES